jgi:hypothetical protein
MFCGQQRCQETVPLSRQSNNLTGTPQCGARQSIFLDDASVSQISRPPRCWVYSCSLPRFSTQVPLPLYLKDYRATLLRHPAAQWAAGIYRLHRGYSAEVAKGTAAP